MCSKMNINMFVNSSWFKPQILSRQWATWSKVASAFNSKPSKIKSLKSQFLGKSTGLFNYADLQKPNGFYLLMDKAVCKSQLLIQEILSPDRKRKMVSVFDELSDTLCKVADLAEFVRIAHPQERFTYAAKETSICINNLVEELNTNRDLYLKLKEVVENGDVSFTDSTDKYIASLFLFDFEQSGIHLDKETREKIVQCNDYILHVGSNFMKKTLNSRTVPKSQLPEAIQHCFAGDCETVEDGIFFHSNNELLNEASYKKFLYSEILQEELLNQLLHSRQRLATLCNFPTYAHRAVRGSIAGTPEFVDKFLRLTNEKIKANVDRDYSILLKLKQKTFQESNSLMPWNVPYLIEKYKNTEFGVSTSDYSPYFSLGACMDGLNYVFNALYNITLKVEDFTNGELWHVDVKKLCVLDGTKTLGYIYCDFFERPNKPNQDCHFTIQGGRLCSDGTYQKPIVVLMLNLPNPSLTQPSLLSQCMVDNLFHEMGHAMHSMLARTTYQHVTGTRCSMDLAEVPSILMEYFASDPRVVSKFARHYKTGETIPLNLVLKLQSFKWMFSACEMQQQVFYAAFDQACHSHKFQKCSTIDLLAEVQSIYYSLSHLPNTTWHIPFGHFLGYGAKYYSYLISRAVASWIWHQYFKDNPLNRREGDRYRNGILSYGGSKPPRQLVEQYLCAEITPETLSNALLRDINSYNYVK